MFFVSARGSECHDVEFIVLSSPVFRWLVGGRHSPYPAAAIRHRSAGGVTWWTAESSLRAAGTG